VDEWWGRVGEVVFGGKINLPGKQKKRDSKVIRLSLRVEL
jgi:hypothetical protein